MDVEKVAGTAVAVSGLAALGPIGFVIIGVGAVGVGIAAYCAGNSTGQKKAADQQAIIQKLEARLRDVENELAATKNKSKNIIDRLLAERKALRAEISRLQREAA